MSALTRLLLATHTPRATLGNYAIDNVDPALSDGYTRTILATYPQLTDVRCVRNCQHRQHVPPLVFQQRHAGPIRRPRARVCPQQLKGRLWRLDTSCDRV